jgi:hypothetical protein
MRFSEHNCLHFTPSSPANGFFHGVHYSLTTTVSIYNTVSLFQVASCILVLLEQRPTNYTDKAARNPRNKLRSLFSEIQDKGQQLYWVIFSPQPNRYDIQVR